MKTFKQFLLELYDHLGEELPWDLTDEVPEEDRSDLTTLRGLHHEPKDSGLVSTRLPYRRGEKESYAHDLHGVNRLTVGLDLEGNVNYVSKKLQQFLRPASSTTLPKHSWQATSGKFVKGESPMDTAKRSHEFIVGNQEHHIARYEKSFGELAERSKSWYTGAGAIGNRFAKTYDVHPHVVAAVIASQSPGTDWNRNVSNAERLIHTYTTQQNTQTNQKMVTAADYVFHDHRKNKKNQYIDKEGNVTTNPKEYVIHTEHQELKSAVLGTGGKHPRLKDMKNSREKAAWIRLYDTSHHDSRHREITPEGDFGDFVQTKAGQNAKIGWGSFNMIANGIDALESVNHDGSLNMNKLSKSLGKAHKVRSFYNNQVNPNANDVTADTHMGAASTLDTSLSQKSPEINDMFTAPPNRRSGQGGLYAHVATATRELAKRRGYRPSSAQSQVWDAEKALKDASSDETNQTNRDNLIRHGLGQISAAELRRKFDKNNPVAQPAWSKTNTSANNISTFL